MKVVVFIRWRNCLHNNTVERARGPTNTSRTNKKRERGGSVRLASHTRGREKNSTNWFVAKRGSLVKAPTP